MPETNHARPSLRMLDEEQIQLIHRSALQILSQTGVRVDSEAARGLLERQVGAAALQGDRVRLPGELVEWALQTAPPTVDLYDRRGNFAFRLGEGRARFGIGVTTLFYQDPGDDSLSPFRRDHMQDMVRLGGRLPNFDVISTVGIVQDVPVHLSDLYGTLEMAANTTKPLVLLVSNEHSFEPVLDLLAYLAGELATRPFVLPYFNPVTPLVMNAGTIDKMGSAIARGLPVIFSNYSMAGVSTPITPAGTLAVLVAELLAGLTIGQVMKAGAPMILGILPAYFDLKTMMNFYDPQSLLMNLACSELMAYYRLPHCSTSGSGTGWGPDLLAAETYWMNHLTTGLTKGGLAPFVGDTLGSKAFSPANVIYVHEIIEQALRFAQGFSLDPSAFGLDEIDRVGPGGDFLRAPLTRKLYRQAYYSSPIFERWSLEKWVAEGRPAAFQILREYTRQVLSELQAPEDHPELIARGEAFIQALA